jgi:hypothetical protein
VNLTPAPVYLGGFFLPRHIFTALIPRMATKTTFICDCCLRRSDNNLGWAHVSINGASDGKQLMSDENRDLCEICWSPLQTLMKQVHDEAREKRNLSDADPSKSD